MSRDLARNKGKIYGQIGVDDMVCPCDCAYCAFASINVKEKAKETDLRVFRPKKDRESVLMEDQFKEILEAFKEAHVDMVSLMATSALSLSTLASMVKTAKTTLDKDQEVFVNYRDMDSVEIQELVDAGADGFYHALRVCEGKITKIEPAARLATMKAIAENKSAKLMTGVEPVWQNMDDEELHSLANVILETSKFDAYQTGVCGLYSIKGGSLDRRPPTESWVQHVSAVLRIACNFKSPLGCAGGVMWVDAGADPRDRGIKSSHDAILANTHRSAESLKRKGWELNKYL